MKKVFLMVLALLIACTGAMAAEWAEGCGPENPYADAQGKPVDFNTTTGYMIMVPLKKSEAEAGVHSMVIYMPREDVECGKGTMYLHDIEGNLLAQVDLSSGCFFKRAMTEEELFDLQWGCGTAFTVELGCVLPAEAEYVVQLTQGAIIAPDYKGEGHESPAIAGRDTWTFTIGAEGEYGIDSMFIMRGAYSIPTAAAEAETDDRAPDTALTEEELRAAEEAAAAAEEAPVELKKPDDALALGSPLKVGDTVCFVVRVGGEATSAGVYLVSGDLEASDTYFEKDAAVTLTLTRSGDIEWGVLWQDKDGNILNAEEFTYHVQ